MMPSEIPQGSTVLAAIRVCGGLLPQHPESRIVEAVDACEAATNELGASDLDTLVVRAVEQLGGRVYEVECSLDALSRTDRGFPCLLRAERPLVVLEAKKSRVLIDDLSGGRRWVEREQLSAPQGSSWWLASPTLRLQGIAARGPIRRLLSYLREESGLVQLVIAYAIGVELLSLAAPLTVQVLINTIGFGMLVQPLLVLSTILMVALAGAAALKVLQIITVEQMARRFVTRVAVDFSERLGRLGSAEGNHGIAAHRFFEIASVDKALFVLGLDLVGLTLQVLTAAVLLAVYHPLLLGFTVALSTLAYLVIRVPLRVALERSLAESNAKYALGEWLAGEPREDDVTQHRLVARWLETRKGAFSISIKQQVALFAIQVSFGAGLLFVGGHLVILGQLTLGQLVAAELVTSMALLSLGKLGKHLPTVYDLLTSFEKLGRVVDLPLSSGPGPSARQTAASLSAAAASEGEAK